LAPFLCGDSQFQTLVCGGKTVELMGRLAVTDFFTAAWSGCLAQAADDANGHGAHVLFVTHCIKLAANEPAPNTTTRRTSLF